MDIGLEDIKPQDCEITVGGETYTLRKFDLGDEAWMKETFLSAGQQLFTESMTDEQICRIAFHQLSIKDKEKFQPTDVTVINEDTGEKTTIKVGGWRLFRLKISGPEEKLELFKGIMHNIGISRPMLNKILDEDERKKLMLNDDTSKKKKPTGRK